MAEAGRLIMLGDTPGLLQVVTSDAAPSRRRAISGCWGWLVGGWVLCSQIRG